MKTKIIINGLNLKQAIASLNYMQNDPGSSYPPDVDLEKMTEILLKIEESVNEDHQSLFAFIYNYFKTD